MLSAFGSSGLCLDLVGSLQRRLCCLSLSHLPYLVEPVMFAVRLDCIQFWELVTRREFRDLQASMTRVGGGLDTGEKVQGD